MSHLLDIHANGQAAFASAHQHAWHRLGTVLDHRFSAEEAMEHALLGDWNVRKLPLTAHDDAGNAVPVSGSYATVRTNPLTRGIDVLGTVGSRYTPIQNEEHCEMLNALLEASGGHFETAGALRGGREVFVSTKIPDHMLIGGVDRVDLYILAMNSHDGTSPYRFAITPIRVVCNNTLSAALRGARSVFKIRHTRNYRANIAAARQALDLTFTYRDAFAAEAERMIEETMTDIQFEAMTLKLFPEPSPDSPPITIQRHGQRLNELKKLFTQAPTMTDIRGTAWAGYQAITEYLDHYAPTQTNKWADNEESARALRSTTPAIINTKNHAFDLIANH